MAPLSIDDGASLRTDPTCHNSVSWWLSILGIDVLNNGDKKHFGLLSILRCFQGICYFLALPYIYYIVMLNGHLAQNHGNVGNTIIVGMYYCVGNCTPPLCYLWAIYLCKNKTSQRLMCKLQDQDSKLSQWNFGGKMYNVVITQSILFTLLMLIIYLFWLNGMDLDLGPRVYFNFLGVTFIARLMLVFICYMYYLVHCSDISIGINQFRELLLNHRVYSLQGISELYIEKNKNVRTMLNDWRYFWFAIVIVPIIEFVLQIIMVYLGFLRYEDDYFFLIYELHYFALAWIVIYQASIVAAEWKKTSMLLISLVASGSLVLSKDRKRESSKSRKCTALDHVSVDYLEQERNPSLTEDINVYSLQTQALLMAASNCSAPRCFGLDINPRFGMKLLYVIVALSIYMISNIR